MKQARIYVILLAPENGRKPPPKEAVHHPGKPKVSSSELRATVSRHCARGSAFTSPDACKKPSPVAD